MNRLPVELVSQILMLRATNDASCPRNHAALMLSHVSRAWRAVCLATPGLWALVKLSWPTKMVEHYLYFSKKHVLEVVFDLSPARRLGALELFFDIVRPHSSRWDSLFILCRVDSRALHDVLAFISKLSTPNLVSMAVQMFPARGQQSMPARTPRTQVGFQPTPRLRHLAVQSVSLDQFHGMISISELNIDCGPCSRRAHTPTGSEILSLLHHLPRLERLYLQQADDCHPTEAIGQQPCLTIRLVNLHVLKVKFGKRWPAFTTVLRNLSCPRLEALSLHVSQSAQVDCSNVLSSVSSTRMPKIKVLIVRLASSTLDLSHELLILVNQFSMLRGVHLDAKCCLSDALFQSGTRFPILQEFILSNSESITKQGLFTLLERWMGLPKVKHGTRISILRCSSVGSRDIMELRELVGQQGIQIVFRAREFNEEVQIFPSYSGK